MGSKIATRLILSVLVYSLAAPALAQQDPAGEEVETDAADDSDATEESLEEDSSSETDDEEAFDDEEEEELTEEPMSESSAPEPVNLDMSALGEIDPEKDLAKGGIVDETVLSTASAQDWTERKMDILELHGYFRVRPELYHKFHIRNDDSLFDRTQTAKNDSTSDPEGYIGEDCRKDGGRRPCKNATLAGANMRLRIEPTLNISEEVWIKTQIDFLDNVMLGSTPRYWQNYGPTRGNQIETGRMQDWNMNAPGQSDMIVVRRAWGEVMTPLGQLRFGRMGDHWGLGMLHNAGNGLNDDFGDSVDRLMFAAKINDWLIAPAFDFPNEGTSGKDASGRPFDVSQLDDAYQLVGIVAYKHDKEEQLAMLKRGDWLINTGLYFTYRWQVLSFEEDTQTGDDHFYRRDMWAITPDFWFQFLYDTFHFELEFALRYGEIGNPDRDLLNFDEAQPLTLAQFGGVVQIDYGLLSDQLRIGLEFGFASGDKDVDSLRAPSTYHQPNGERNDTYSAFAFNPSYNTDLILYHHILGSVSQSYYFNAWLKYDFLKGAMGRMMSIQVDALYSRAVFSESTINQNSANLGIELNAQATYVTEDRFYAGIKYGVLFPLGAFKGKPYWDPDSDTPDPYVNDTSLVKPQTLQVILGITY